MSADRESFYLSLYGWRHTPGNVVIWKVEIDKKYLYIAKVWAKSATRYIYIYIYIQRLTTVTPKLRSKCYSPKCDHNIGVVLYISIDIFNHQLSTHTHTHTRPRARAHTHTHTHTLIQYNMPSVSWQSQIQNISAPDSISRGHWVQSIA